MENSESLHFLRIMFRPLHWVKGRGSYSSPYSEAHSFATETQNDTIFMPWESRHHKISGNTKFAQIRHWELGQPKAGKTTKISQSVGKLPTIVIRCTTFAHKVFLILTMSFQKVYAFSKRETSSTTRFSRFVKSFSELIGIRAGKLEKTIPNVENSSDCHTSRSCIFLHRSQNHARSIPLEI
jgi:hypothetical protein